MNEMACVGGLVLALSAFATKAGLGSAAVCFDDSLGWRKRIAFPCATLLAYGALFLGLLWLVNRWSPVMNLGGFLRALRYGMLVHLATALGLLLWGLRLLGQSVSPMHGTPGNGQASGKVPHGALLLVFPCPICASVMLVTLAFGYDLLPFSPMWTTVLAWGAFATIFMFTLGILWGFRRRIAGGGAGFLGAVMIAVALYFLMMVLVAPVYQEAREIYSLACGVGSDGGVALRHRLPTVCVGAALFGIGFLRQTQMTRHKRLRKG